jgi:hypothetical protein
VDHPSLRLSARRGHFGDADMKKSILLILDDDQLIELKRILMDEDAPAALHFLKEHLRSKAAALLDGRAKVRLNVRGADTAQDGVDGPPE